IHTISSAEHQEEIEQLLSKLQQSSDHGLYIEAIGENPHHATLEGISISFDEDVFCITTSMITYEGLKPFMNWLADEEIAKYGYDVHKVELVVRWQGIAFGGASFDVQLAAYLLDPTDGSQLLHSIAERHQLQGLPSDEEVYGKGAKFKLPEEQELL